MRKRVEYLREDQDEARVKRSLDIFFYFFYSSSSKCTRSAAGRRAGEGRQHAFFCNERDLIEIFFWRKFKHRPKAISKKKIMKKKEREIN